MRQLIWSRTGNHRPRRGPYINPANYCVIPAAAKRRAGIQQKARYAGFPPSREWPDADHKLFYFIADSYETGLDIILVDND